MSGHFSRPESSFVLWGRRGFAVERRQPQAVDVYQVGFGCLVCSGFGVFEVWVDQGFVFGVLVFRCLDWGLGV